MVNIETRITDYMAAYFKFPPAHSDNWCEADELEELRDNNSQRLIYTSPSLLYCIMLRKLCTDKLHWVGRGVLYG